MDSDTGDKPRPAVINCGLARGDSRSAFDVDSGHSRQIALNVKAVPDEAARGYVLLFIREELGKFWPQHVGLDCHVESAMLPELGEPISRIRTSQKMPDRFHGSMFRHHLRESDWV